MRNVFKKIHLEYYKEIIERLNLTDNGSNAHVIGSESYADRDFD